MLPMGPKKNIPDRQYTHRPVLKATVAFAAGIAMDRILQPPAATGVAVVGACVVLVPLLLFFRRNQWASALVLLLAVGAGLVGHYVRCRRIPENHVSRFATDQKKAVRLTGTVWRAPTYSQRHAHLESGASVSFILDDLTILLDDGGVLPVTGRVQVRTVLDATNPALVDLDYGARVELFGRPGAIAGPPNPGQMDFRKYYEGMGVYGAFSFLDPGRVKSLEGAGGSRFPRLAAGIKQRLNEVVFHNAGRNGYLAREQAKLVAALTLGDRSGIDMDDFRETGSIHFLAISGLHLAILTSLLFWVLRLCRVERRTAAGIVVAVVITYATVTGLRPPVVRAATMITLFLIADVICRHRDLLNILALAALLLLIMNPANLFLVGFQLSFIAVICILVFHRPIDAAAARLFATQPFARLKKSRTPWFLRFLFQYVRRSLNVSLSVWIGLFPILALVFHLCTPMTLLVNVVLFPFIAAILCLSAVVFVLGGVFGVFLSSPYVALAWLVDAVKNIANFFAMDGKSHIHLVGFSLFLVVAYYVILLAWINRRRLRLKPVWLVPAMAAVLVAVIVRHNSPVRPPYTEITLLAVGEGGVAVIQTSDGRTALFGAGGWKKNVGRYRIVPFLDTLRARTLDAVILPGSNFFNARALPRLRRTLSVQDIYGLSEGEPLVTGFSRRIGNDATITILDTEGTMMLEAEGKRVLFVGNFDEATVERLLRSGRDLRAHVLITPTRKRGGSSFRKFLEAVNPDLHEVTRRHGAATIRLAPEIETETWLPNRR